MKLFSNLQPVDIDFIKSCVQFVLDSKLITLSLSRLKLRIRDRGFIIAISGYVYKCHYTC